MSFDIKAFQKFIYSTLSVIIPDPQARKNYVTRDPMLIWVDVFTHQTVDIENNYEKLEILGDRVLETVFTDYMMSHFPQLDAAMMTELKSQYMSKMRQAELAKDLNFGQYIRVQDVEINVHILEDVFEAFVGGLFRTSDSVAGRGQGYLNAYAFIEYIFKDVSIDMNLAYGRAKTQVRQLYFERLGWGEPIEEITPNTGEDVIVQLKITPAGRRYLRERNINIPIIIGKGMAPTKIGAMDLAYTEALNNFQKRGLTREWTVMEKEIKDFQNPQLIDLVPAAQKRLTEDGFVRMKFVVPRTTQTKTNCVVQLIGIRADNSEKILASTTTENCAWVPGRRRLLEEYSQA